MIKLINQDFINLSQSGVKTITSSFDLNQISGAVFYYDAQDATKSTDVGSGVISELIDKTNSSLKCTAAAGKRPIRTANALNGKYGILFDGTDDFYTGPAGVMGASYTKVITFLLDSFEASTLSYNLITSGAASGNRHQLSALKFSSTVMRFNDAFVGTTIQYDTDLLNCNGVITLIKVGTAGDYRLYMNGVLIKSSTSSLSNADTTWLVGAFNSGTPQNFFKGYIGDIAIYNRALSDGGTTVGSVAGGEIAQVDAHQKAKYRRPSGTLLTILGCGQSNEVGKATVKSDPNTAYIGLDYIYSLRHFRDLKDSTSESYSVANIGSSHPPLVAKINSLSGRQVIYCGSSKTGTFISSTGAADANSHWGPGGNLRVNAVTYAQAMLAQVGSLDWIIINQGEANANYMVSNPSYTQAIYKSDYEALIDYLRGFFPTTKILIVKTVTARNAGTDVAAAPTQYAAVQAAQQAIADERSSYVKIITDAVSFTTSGGHLEADGLHYTKAANLIIGNSAGQKIYDNL